MRGDHGPEAARADGPGPKQDPRDSITRQLDALRSDINASKTDLDEIIEASRARSRRFDRSPTDAD